MDVTDERTGMVSRFRRTPIGRSIFRAPPRVTPRDRAAGHWSNFLLHAFTFWVFLAVFPFTRLVHIITLPLGYLTRPWQKVVRMRETPAVYHSAADKPRERTH